MSAENTPGSEKRAKRSTRLGIALLIALALIVIALIWAFQDDDEPDAPSVYAPVTVAISGIGDHSAQLAA